MKRSAPWFAPGFNSTKNRIKRAEARAEGHRMRQLQEELCPKFTGYPGINEGSYGDEEEPTFKNLFPR